MCSHLHGLDEFDAQATFPEGIVIDENGLVGNPTYFICDMTFKSRFLTLQTVA
jgi:hypothetical protein